MRGVGAAGPDLMQGGKKVSAWGRVVQGTLLFLTPRGGFPGAPWYDSFEADVEAGLSRPFPCQFIENLCLWPLILEESLLLSYMSW